MNILLIMLIIVGGGVGAYFYSRVNNNLKSALVHKNSLEENLSNLEKMLVEKQATIEFYKTKFPEHIESAELLRRLQQEVESSENEVAQLKAQYREKKAIYDALQAEAAIYDETIALAEEGFYKPHFDFDTSEQYKTSLSAVREEQKAMVSGGRAVLCRTEWTVHGSAVEGRKMTRQGIRLATRAFNNERDAAIANTTWKNANTMEKRIIRSFEAINKLNQSSQIEITRAYLNQKLKEFYLAHEYAEKRKREREERAELRAAAREEAKLEQEIAAAQREEEKYQRLLDKAKADAEKASGHKLEILKEKITELTDELAIAHAKNERAISMAQQTRAGYVYIISNIGSFGTGIHKIGMTRRLDPMDRVRELGDASVPFSFDVHALIYCDDAPALENTLHKTFADKRLNLRNLRREFFEVPLDEIEAVVRQSFPDAEFIIDPEAQDYFESLAIREEMLQLQDKKQSAFPDEI